MTAYMKIYIPHKPGNNPLPDALILRQGVDGLDVILGHCIRRRLLIVPHHMIGDDDRSKDGETILGVEARVVAVAVDPRQLNLIPRPHLMNSTPFIFRNCLSQTHDTYYAD